jgi:hypothetical protein
MFAPLKTRRVSYLPVKTVPQGHPVWTTQALAGELSRENGEHGAPWVSFGDVHVDDGGNAYAVDRSQTCYLRSDEPMPRSLWAEHARGANRKLATIYRTSDGDDLCYAVTLPAYNVWWRAREAGLHPDDYGRSWTIYPSRADYVEGLS